MTRQELLAIAKPILFNTPMVQAILDNRKTVTRRVIKPQPKYCIMTASGALKSDEPITVKNGLVLASYGKLIKLPYQVGDILYVRETGLIQSMKAFGNKVKMLFKADDSLVEFSVSEKEYNRLSKWAYFQKWLSPYWLTKETARIFLRVTSVRVEHLQDITEEQAEKEGAISDTCEFDDFHTAKEDYKSIWDSTIPKADLDRYGWNANPWVGAYEFERIEVE